MYLYIGNLTREVDKHRLQSLFARYLDARSRLELVRDDGSGHGLVRVRSTLRARLAALRLDGSLFHERRLIVREFVFRSCYSERRALNWRALQWPHLERRHAERRMRALFASNADTTEL